MCSLSAVGTTTTVSRSVTLQLLLMVVVVTCRSVVETSGDMISEAASTVNVTITVVDTAPSPALLPCRMLVQMVAHDGTLVSLLPPTVESRFDPANKLLHEVKPLAVNGASPRAPILAQFVVALLGCFCLALLCLPIELCLSLSVASSRFVVRTGTELWFATSGMAEDIAVCHLPQLITFLLQKYLCIIAYHLFESESNP